MEKVSKREHKFRNYFRVAASGKFPLPPRDLFDCLDYINKQTLKYEPAEKCFEVTYALAIAFFRERYGKAKSLPHAIRFANIAKFMEDFRDRLICVGLIKKQGRIDSVDETLLVALSRLPFSPFQGFQYEEVMEYILKSRAPN